MCGISELNVLYAPPPIINQCGTVGVFATYYQKSNSAWGGGVIFSLELQDTRYKIQDVYLGISSYPEWVVYRKMPEQMLLKSIKVCKYK